MQARNERTVTALFFIKVCVTVCVRVGQRAKDEILMLCECALASRTTMAPFAQKKETFQD